METEQESKFKNAYSFVIGNYEGKYSMDKDDPGGETYKGIARTKNPGFAGWKIIDGLKSGGNFPEILEKSGLLQEMVMNFYKINYWDKFWGDKLEAETAKEMFDQSLNMGTGRAIEHLQRSLNILNEGQTLYPDIKVDGIMGKWTLETYYDCLVPLEEYVLVNVLNMYQGKYYIELMEKKSLFEKFRGLFIRVTLTKQLKEAKEWHG
jgi:lysozyme family protein